MKGKLLFLSAAIVMLTACQSPTEETNEDTSTNNEANSEETSQENTSKENESSEDTSKDNEDNKIDTLANNDSDDDASQGEVTTETYSNVVDGIEVEIEITADKRDYSRQRKWHSVNSASSWKNPVWILWLTKRRRSQSTR